MRPLHELSEEISCLAKWSPASSHDYALIICSNLQCIPWDPHTHTRDANTVTSHTHTRDALARAARTHTHTVETKKELTWLNVDTVDKSAQ